MFCNGSVASMMHDFAMGEWYDKEILQIWLGYTAGNLKPSKIKMKVSINYQRVRTRHLTLRRLSLHAIEAAVNTDAWRVRALVCLRQAP